MGSSSGTARTARASCFGAEADGPSRVRSGGMASSPDPSTLAARSSRRNPPQGSPVIIGGLPTGATMARVSPRAREEIPKSGWLIDQPTIALWSGEQYFHHTHTSLIAANKRDYLLTSNCIMPGNCRRMPVVTILEPTGVIYRE